MLEQVLKMPVSRDMLGRVFNGSGKPIDGGCASHAWLLYSKKPSKSTFKRMHKSKDLC